MDRRESAWDPFYGTFNENTMTGRLYGDRWGDDDDSEVDVVHCRWEVCSVCDGRGSHVNPSIDSNGISAQEFAEDPDFAESYWSGHYDVACYGCGGRRVEPVPDENDPNRDRYYEAIRDHHEHLAEIAAERRVGA